MYAISFKVQHDQSEKTVDQLSPYFSTISCFEDTTSPDSGKVDQDGFPIPQLFDIEIIVQDKTQACLIDHLLTQKVDITITKLENQDWLKVCYQNFKPIQVKNFFIYSSYTNETVPKGFLGLKLDASTAFGSGEHQTTKGCLTALDEVMEEKKCTHILDMGCGSGILGLCAALKNKHSDVTGVDIDETAVDVSNNNAQLNNVKNFKAFDTKTYEKMPPQNYQLILANILARPLIEMAQTLYNTLEEGGYIILSGLIENQKELVEKAYRGKGFHLVKAISIDTWVTLVFKK